MSRSGARPGSGETCSFTNGTARQRRLGRQGVFGGVRRRHLFVDKAGYRVMATSRFPEESLAPRNMPSVLNSNTIRPAASIAMMPPLPPSDPIVS